VQLHLGLAITLRKNGSNDQAIEELRKAVALDPNLARRSQK
jgi:Flp pilus assembly protein TadD